ncbi:MAG TPA: UDP-glucose/GDP-mannose dehydrogenase family protein, partial [Micromonosporaceae bacterium]|nr:UDP-glucose/GDP-mannose dehydrogenase family protein [Micromonosporaceae bacterium]
VRAGAQVTVYDPEGMANAVLEVPEVGYAKTLTSAVDGADLVCVLTEWEEFRNADPIALGRLVAGKRVVDGRNCLDQAVWTRAGWDYRGLGRPVTP